MPKPSIQPQFSVSKKDDDYCLRTVVKTELVKLMLMLFPFHLPPLRFPKHHGCMRENGDRTGWGWGEKARGRDLFLPLGCVYPKDALINDEEGIMKMEMGR